MSKYVYDIFIPMQYHILSHVDLYVMKCIPEYKIVTYFSIYESGDSLFIIQYIVLY